MPFWRIFGVPAFARYWLGDLLAGVASAIMQVAMLWYLSVHGQSPRELGWFVFLSSTPVAVGGPFVAFLFRRLQVRAVMLLDLAVRASAYACVVALFRPRGGHGVDGLVLDLVAAATAFTSMAPMAGGPGLWPGLLPQQEIRHAMQAEQLGWNLSSVFAPLLAGALVAGWGIRPLAATAAFVAIAAATNLATIRLRRAPVAESRVSKTDGFGSFLEVLHIVLSDRRLWLTTGLFWAVNVVGGALEVILPLAVHQFWRGDADLYGSLLAAGALGGLLGSATLAGWRAGSAMRRVLLGEAASGAMLLLLVPGLHQPVFAFAALAGSSAIGAATATWVMELRFEAIGEGPRPAALSYIRTFLWTASPLGGLAAGYLWHPGSAPLLIASLVGAALFAAFAGLHLTRLPKRRAAKRSAGRPTA